MFHQQPKPLKMKVFFSNLGLRTIDMYNII